MLGKIVFLFVAISVLVCSVASADQFPYDNSNVRYFYVFGQDGDPLMGAEDSELILYVDVPQNETNDVVISVYDPGTGGKHDWRVPNSDWDTTTEIAVYGKELLDSKEFGADEYDGQYYQFGPYNKEKGEKVGGFNRFRLVVTGLSGDDENLFKVKVSPDSADVFSENITIRLLPDQGDHMYFYPEVPAGVNKIIVRNYDLDAEGGISTIAMDALSKKHYVNDSKSGEWAETIIPISTSTKGKVVYTIIKGTQRYANAGLEITDEGGEPLRIYFRKGKPPVAKKMVPIVKAKPAPVKKDTRCNKFTFDATSSYDVDKQNLSYLWNFGDGQTSTEPVVTHIYEEGGEYNVTLNVQDDSGLPCDSAGTSQKVYVNTPPEAAFSAPELVCDGDTVTFNASATKDDDPENLTFGWNFGDGSRGEGETATHIYTKGGNYNVTLTVNDNSGTQCNLDSVQRPIRVNAPPIAVAGNDISMCLGSLDREYVVTLDGSSSRDGNGDKLNYSWDLGDGSSEQGEKITHVYDTSGTYTVNLTVDDGSESACSSDSDTLTVKLNKAPVAVAGENQKVCTGENVTFDGGDSRTEPGEGLAYYWSFGDGTKGEGETIDHTYAKGGKYTVALTVDDGRDTSCSLSQDSLQVEVNSSPVANLEEVKNTCVGKTVSFDASGSKDADRDSLDYSWNFGDGTQETSGSKTKHVYQKGGTYNVSVTVDDGADSPCSSDSDVIKVNVNAPPTAKMEINRACCIDMEQKFSAGASSDPDGDSLTYMWNFGDGTTAQGENVSHTYPKPGTYKVMLTVNDGSGTECSSDVTFESIIVNASPVAVIKIR